MPSHDKKGRSKKREQFVPIPVVMLRSPAWRSLSGGAVKIYVELRGRYNGGNNGDLSLSYGEAARLLHLGKTTVKRAYDELQAKGFIKKTSLGHWYGRKATTWATTDRKLKDDLASNDWMNWHKRNANGKTELGTHTGRKQPLRSASVPQKRNGVVCVPSQYPSGEIAPSDGSV